jgi:hypothetical protein
MSELLADLRPEAARTPGEYVALLRRLRKLSSLTYREISERAEVVGDVLPTSTLATMLGRNTLPREQLVAALVRACGLGPGEVERWLDVRRQLVSDEMPEPNGAPAQQAGPNLRNQMGPVRPTEEPDSLTRTRRGWPIPAAIGFVAGALVATAASIALAAGRSPEPSQPQQENRLVGRDEQASAELPEPGGYRLRLAHSGMCVSERPESDLGHVFQTDCADAMPPMTLDAVGDELFRIRTNHPRFGQGCMGVDHASRESPGIVADGYCDTDSAQDFRLEPVAKPVQGFRIRPAHSNMCLGVVDGSTDVWAPVRQLHCEEDAASQVFLLDPA